MLRVLGEGGVRGGGGGHLALKGNAGPRAASPGETADPRVGCPGDHWP